jgi:hypothetical protein
MLSRVALVRTDVLEELSASFIRVTRLGELGTTLAVTSNRSVRRLLVTASVVPSSPTKHIQTVEINILQDQVTLRPSFRVVDTSLACRS